MSENKRKVFRWLFTGVMLLAGISLFAQDWDQGQWIDLTYSYSAETIYWPTSAPFEKNHRV